MTEQKSMYEKLGIDPSKKSVRKIFGGLIDNDYPGAWVNIVKDPDFSGYVFTQHNDGDGSKFVQRILVYNVTGDVSVIGGAVDDALQMNLGDIAASGFVNGKIVVTDIIDINGFNVSKEIVMNEIKKRFIDLKELHKSHGFNIYMLGGETADLPDQVQSVVFNVSVYARANEEDIISGNVVPGDVIYGFASDGRAIWEPDEYNFGIMANGLTLARKKTMWSIYSKLYPELSNINGAYTGKFKVGEKAKNMHEADISRALLSPTRQWSLLIRLLIEKLKENNALDALHGISFNTGGGASKIMHLGKGGIYYRKKMPHPASIFKFIQKESEEKWEYMYQTFNCGIGIDIVGEPCNELCDVLDAVADETGVKLYKLGYCEETHTEENHVELVTDFGIFNY